MAISITTLLRILQIKKYLVLNLQTILLKTYNYLTNNIIKNITNHVFEHYLTHITCSLNLRFSFD